VKRLFSGVQPSGELHIGNYLGAIRNWVTLQESFECIFCVVDYHAITQPYAVEDMAPRIMDAATWILACGVDPEKATLFVQSDVPEHTELAWILNSVATMGDLNRMTQFKEKAEQQASVNAGIFTYPVLQTADIVLYKAERVPVGEDQLQHLELAREIVRSFNARFGPIFPEPQAHTGTARRIMGLDNQFKMSKSRGNTIALGEASEAVMAKLAPAVTDVNRKRLKDPGDPEKCNVYTLHTHFSPEPVVEDVAAQCRAAGRGCLDCKKILHRHLMDDLAPIQARAAELKAHPERVRDILAAGAEHCRKVAQETLREVREKMGLCRTGGRIS
jgi:tryptophanyl-tRNA synthetase